MTGDMTTYSSLTSSFPNWHLKTVATLYRILIEFFAAHFGNFLLLLNHAIHVNSRDWLKCDDVKLLEKCKKSREKLNPVHRILSHFWPKRMSDFVLRKNSPIMRHFLSIFCPTVRQSSTAAVSIIGRWYVKYDYVRSLISVSVHQTR